jgi:3-dehydroquinate synthase
MIRVHAGVASREHDVLVGRGCLGDLGGALWSRAPGGQAVVCCDENVAPLYLEQTRTSMVKAGYSVSHVVVPAGERQKNLARAEELYGVLYDRGVRRSDTVLALGGGVIGDLVGHVAATFQRGVRFAQVPTTLLAQVDAAIGGKVAVDFRAGKNYVGTFYQPWLVFADLMLLDTLPERELRSGAAEVAKYALLCGGDMLERVERLSGAVLAAGRVSQELVAGCARYKLGVVVEDEREETGRRAVLNLGHTLGHAIEAATGFSRFSHGEAVALGLRASLWLSRRLCDLSAAEEARGLALLDGLGLPARLGGVAANDIAALTRRDKKAGPGGVGYVLLDALGVPRLDVHVPPGLEVEVSRWLTSP